MKYGKYYTVRPEHTEVQGYIDYVLNCLKQDLLQAIGDNIKDGESKVVRFTDVSIEDCGFDRSRIYKQTVTADDVYLCHECEYYDELSHWCNKYHAPMFPNDFCSRGRKREE